LFHTITDDCILCDACPRECPVEAIRKGPKKYVIDREACLDCGACVEVCPTEAIVCDAKNEAEVMHGWAASRADIPTG